MNLLMDCIMFQNVWVVDDFEVEICKWVEVLGVGLFFVVEYDENLMDIYYCGKFSEFLMKVVFV